MILIHVHACFLVYSFKLRRKYTEKYKRVKVKYYPSLQLYCHIRIYAVYRTLHNWTLSCSRLLHWTRHQTMQWIGNTVCYRSLHPYNASHWGDNGSLLATCADWHSVQVRTFARLCVHRRCCLRLWTKLSQTRDQKTAPWHQYSRSLFTHPLQRLSLLSRLIGSYNGWECVSAPDKYTIWDDTHVCGHGLTHNDQYDRHALARRRQKELQTRVTQSDKFVGMPNFRLSIIRMWHVQ